MVTKIAKLTPYAEEILAREKEKPVEPTPLSVDSLRRLYPDIFEAPAVGYGKGGIITTETTPEMVRDTIYSFARDNPDEFLDDIRTMGKNSDTVGLLKSFGLDDTDIYNVFKSEIPIPPVPPSKVTVPAVSPPRLTEYIKDYFIAQGQENLFPRDMGGTFNRAFAPSEEVSKADNLLREASLSYKKEFGTGVWLKAGPIERAQELKVFGQVLTKVPRQTAATILQATQGALGTGGLTGASVVDRDWADRFIQEANVDIDKFVTDVMEKYGGEPSFLTEIAQLPRNISYSLTSLGAGLVVGVPVALAPVPGARIAAYTLGTAASGAVAYQMTTYQIMQQYLELKNDESIAQTGRGLTLEEENRLKRDFSSKAHRYGLWEAIPEAISNLGFVTILTAPLTSIVGKSTALKIIAKLVGIYGEELLTETITQKGQSAIEVKAGLREGEISWVEAFKEVAPQTFLLTTVLAGSGQVVISSSQAINRVSTSLKNEIGEKHPLFNEIRRNIETRLAEAVEEARVRPELGAITPEPVTPTKVTPTVPTPVTEAVVSTTKWKQALTEADQTMLSLETGQLRPDLTAGTKEYQSFIDSEITRIAKKYGVPETILRKQTLWEAVEAKAEPRKPLTTAEIDELVAGVAPPRRPMTRERWDDMEINQRAIEAKAQGLNPAVGKKTWVELTTQEKQVLSGLKPEVAVPTREVGMPEAVKAEKVTIRETLSEPKEYVLTIGNWAAPTWREVFTTRKEATQARKEILAGTYFEKIATRLKAITPPAEVAPKEIFPGITEKPRIGIIPESIEEAARLAREVEIPVTEKAVNIRLEKYTEEVRPLISEWAETHLTEVQEARRGIVSDKQVRAEAEKLTNEVGGDLDKLRRRWKPATTWNAEELVAIRSVLQEKTKAVINAQKIVRESNTTENLLKLELALKEQAAVQEMVHGLTAEAGRALRSFRQEVFDAIRSNDTEKMEAILRKIGGREKTEKIAQMLSQIDVNDPIAVNKFIQSLYKPNMMDYLTELFYNSILSGPKTHIVNSLSNTANAIFSPVERFVSALVDMPLAKIQGRAQERYLSEVPADIFGAIRGIPEGFRQFAYVVKNGISFDQATKWEFRQKAFRGKLGVVISMPSRLLEGADTLMKAINQRAAINAESHRIASKEKLTGQAFEDRVAELLSSPTEDMLKEANRIAEYRLFRQPPGKFGTTLMNLREAVDIKGFKPLRFVIPFIRTPINLVKFGLERTPLGFLNPKLWENVSQKNPEAADQIARATIGSIGLATFTWYAAMGFITGAPPRDRAERERFYREGKQPYALRVNGFWVSYQRLEPFNQLLAQASIFGDMIRNNDKGLDERIVDAANTFGQNFISQTYMSSISDLINMLAEPERYAGNWLNRFASSIVIPFSSATRTVTQILDRTVRDPDNAWETIESNIPGLSNRVKAKLTALGEDIERKSPPWFPVNVTPVEETILSQELERLKFDIGFVGKTISGIELTKDEQYEYQKLSGQLIKQDLEKLMLAPEYWQSSDVDKDKMLRQVVDSARDWARMKMREKMWTTGATEERLKVLQTALQESDAQLGKIISAVPEFTHEKPNIYDIANELDASYRSLFGTIPVESISGMMIPPSVLSWFEKEATNKEVNFLVNKSLYQINADKTEGSTFEDYYTQWQERSKLTDERELAEFDKKYPDANLGNISKRQIESLREFHKLIGADKVEYLKSHPELSINPKQDWMESHPKENANLVLWGEGRLLTKESYDEFIKLIESLDVPDLAIKEGSIPEHLDSFLLETEKTFRETLAKIEVAKLLDDEIKDEQGLTARGRAIKELRVTKIDEEYTYADIVRKIEAIEKGTDKIPTPNDIIESWVDRGKTVDQFTAGSSEAKVWLLDHLDTWKWALDNELLTDDGKDWNENVLRINVQWREKDKIYDDLPTEGDARDNYLKGDTDYRIARRQRDFYSLDVPDNNLRDKYVGFYELSDKGYVKERYLVNNLDLELILTNPEIMGSNVRDKVDSSKIPDVRYDDLYFQYEDLFEEYEGYSDGASEFYVADPDDRETKRNGLLARNPDFQGAIWERHGYLLFIGKEQLVPDYVGYYTHIRDNPKPVGANYWFEDDWYLLDHSQLYKGMTDLWTQTKGKQGWNPEERDFSRVPPRDVYEMYLVYDSIIGSADMSQSAARRQYRRTHPKLDAWLFLIGAVSKTIEQYDIDAGMTTAEKIGRDLASKRAEINRLKREIRRKLEAMK